MSLKDFLANPRVFLDSNIVFPPSRGKSMAEHNAELRSRSGKRLTPEQSGVFEFAFVPDGTGKILASGNDCPAFRIQPPDNWNKQHPRFWAYFCSYSDDEMHLFVVDNEADIMLTPRMNGCSFGVGSATDTGARLVMHANHMRQPGQSQDDQERMQGQWIGAAIGEAGNLIGPSRYMLDPNASGTTVGMRKDKKWSFCTQSWKQGKPALLLGVQDFA